jgi:hypothetical protein
MAMTDLKCKINVWVGCSKDLWKKIKKENKVPPGWHATRYDHKVVVSCKDLGSLANMTPEWLERIEATLNLIKVDR